MTGQVAILISLFIYLTFFGWLGWRRGFTRELVVAIIALLGWIALEQRGDIIVSMANLMVAGLDFARNGGFTGNAEEAFTALSSAPAWVNAEMQADFLYVVWVVAFILAYLITGWAIPDKKSEKNGWAILLGILNGFFFAMVFLPSLGALFSSGDSAGDIDVNVDVSMNLFSLIGRGAELLWDMVLGLWGLISPLGSVGILIILTGILVLAAMSIRGDAKAKS